MTGPLGYWMSRAALRMNEATRLDGDLPMAQLAIQCVHGRCDKGTGEEHPLATYRVTVEGEIGRVDVPLSQAVQGA